MRKITNICITAITTLLAFTSVVYTSCNKDGCSGITCQNGGVCANGVCSCPSGYYGNHCENTGSANITYRNNTFTPVVINEGDRSDIVPVGGTVTYSGGYGNRFTATATTSGSFAGASIGKTITWNLDTVFPATDTLYQDINVSNKYFFLRIVNSSSYTVQTLYVNYGLAPQTTDNISIPGDGHVYDIGYYEAYSNSNVKLAATSNTWSYGPLGLTFTANQVALITN